MPKRPVSAHLPEPERASEAVIERCRNEIEGRAKRNIRKLILPILRRRFRLAELGEGFHWPRGLKMRIAPNSRVGRFAYLGQGFEAYGPVVVGDLCMIAAGMKIVGADHLYDRVGTPTRLAFPDDARPLTRFGADVWTGLNVTVMEGLTIGRGAVIGSASVVTKDVPPYTVVAGVPARIVRRRFDDETMLAQHEAAVMGSEAR